MPELIAGPTRIEAAGEPPFQAAHCRPGEWVQYGSPGPEGAEYIAVCLPAFSPDAPHRD
jgi:hypothetical protein